MLSEHEERQGVVAEMHLRRWPSLSAPCTIFQIVKLLDAGERAAEEAAITVIPAISLDPDNNPRHMSGRLAGNVGFTWELQSEASTVTIFVDGVEAMPPLGDAHGNAGAQALHWAISLPGRVVRATRMVVVPEEAQAQAMVADQDFEPMDLISCHIGCSETSACARIWSDFRLRDPGFGFVLVAANGMTGGDLSRTLQRLQELGNYRNLALLGLPLARRGWKVLDKIEHELGQITGKLARDDVTDDALLEEVTQLSIELATEATATDFRMSATEAYAKIVDERLSDLVIRPIEGSLSLVDFTRRRLLPAVRTCAVHRRRSEQLAQRTAQFVSLFRTRIETRIENQNARLLASMDASTARQVRLQQLVEGFSVVALTYYLVALLTHVLEGVSEATMHFNVAVVVAVMTPFLACVMWFAIHHAKARILK